MNDEQKALAAADALIVEHGWPWRIEDGMINSGMVSAERARTLLALAYLTGARDGMKETKALADLAFSRLAADLVKS